MKKNHTTPINFTNASIEFDNDFQLLDINWQLNNQQHWVITGANGTGKSALGASLAGHGKLITGDIQGLPTNVGVVSFAAQEILIEQERKKDDADIMDVISLGTPTREIIFDDCQDPSTAQTLIELFAIEYLLDRAFRKLSTGETRKIMLIKALSCQPNWLLLDEPFEGLDVDTLVQLKQYLSNIQSQIPMVFVLNRIDHIPNFVTHIAYLALDHNPKQSNGRLVSTIATSDTQAMQDLQQLLHIKTTDLTVPHSDPDTAIPALPKDQVLVRLRNITIRYDDFALIDGLNWNIERGEHYQLSGPNGAGKTALLSMITGDHPQCYNNDIFVFGFQRGQGESIWQIKQYIGYVSTALQWEYRVQISLRNVIISGFYDSIGLYTKATDKQKTIADQWLALLGMENRTNEPFQKLSYGDQRLLLIARAMVKHPPLLILDEPCLGLDELNRQLVLALIEKICQSQTTTVIYVNHLVEDSIAGIQNGLRLEKRQ